MRGLPLQSKLQNRAQKLAAQRNHARLRVEGARAQLKALFWMVRKEYPSGIDTQLDLLKDYIDQHWERQLARQADNL